MAQSWDVENKSKINNPNIMDMSIFRIEFLVLGKLPPPPPIRKVEHESIQVTVSLF